MKTSLLALLSITAFSLLEQDANAVTIPTVPVGNPGNPADTRYADSHHPSGVGSVANPFRMGRNEVTNAQYVEFLNAVAAADPFELYNPFMGGMFGGIIRSGVSGSYSYAVKAAALSGTYLYDDKPVASVSSGDAMRFANWLHNGQPTGPENASSTEDGAYTLNGAISDAALAAVTRNVGARWWLPSEDEWYKAAYYDPVTGTYFDYPTATNSVPNNNLPLSDTGNSANFYSDGYTTGNFSFPLTDAGVYTASNSPYGTFDQGGNLREWTETLDPLHSPLRGIRGGHWLSESSELHAAYWLASDPTNETFLAGFRVASAVVPEPEPIILLGLITVAGILYPRRIG